MSEIIHPTRELWLMAVVELAKPFFAEAGKPIPELIRIGVAPPIAKSKWLGACWSEVCSADGGREIWINAAEANPVEIVSTLLHELVHAALPHSAKHGKEFKALGTKIGLEGKARSMGLGSEQKALWEERLKPLGQYPGVPWTGLPRRPGAGEGEQKYKYKNVNCPECGFFAKVRVDQMPLGRLRCPVDDEMMLMKEELE